MKNGRSLQEIAAELERQVDTRKDYIAPQGKLDAVVVGDDVKIDGLPNEEPLAITPYAHKQLADHLGIPAKYYARMQAEQPELLARNITTWFHADATNKRMVRTLDGKVRAFLSPKYRPLDNFDLGTVVLPVLKQHGVQIASCELTETRLYIKGILPSLTDKLPDGLELGVGHTDIRAQRIVVSAIVISNSEVGAGTLRVEPSVYTPWCTNLAILAEAAMKKYHVGRSFSADDSFEVFRDETRRLDDAAFWSKVRDITTAAFNEDTFKAAIAQLRDATQRQITGDLPKVVDLTVERLNLPERLGGSILSHLAKGGDLSAWGLSSAITRTANDADDYELATQLERAGGQVIALSPSDWKVLAEAA